METQVRSQPNPSEMRNATFKLLPEQIEWIRSESDRTGESQNTIMRSLLRMAMQGQFDLKATIGPAPIAN